MISLKTWKENPISYLFGKTWQHSEGNRKKLVCAWILFVCAEMIDTFFLPFVWAKIISIVAVQGITASSLSSIDLMLGLIFARVVVVWALHGTARIMECDNAFLARAQYRKFLTRGLLTLPLAWHTDHHSGDTIDRTAKGTTALYDFSESSFQIVYCFVMLLGSYGMLVYFVTRFRGFS